MSESHKQLLPIIAAHVDRIGYTQGMIEAHLGPKGERADYWAVCRQPVTEAFAEHPECIKDDRLMVSLYPGNTSTHELKVSVADLRADHSKPWRKPGVYAFGQRRWYWLPKGGEVRPEHVYDACGWGAIVFDEHGYEIAKPSARFTKVDRAGEIELAMRITEAKYKDLGRHLQFGRASDTLSQAMPVESTPGTPPATAGPRQKVFKPSGPAWLAFIDEQLDLGPANTATLCRALARDKGVRLSAGKLSQELSQHSRYQQNGGPGGPWSLRTEG